MVRSAVQSVKLTDLKVVELRSELEKRGLDKTGIKAVLIERLQQVLKEEEPLGMAEFVEGIQRIERTSSETDEGPEASNLDSSFEQSSLIENQEIETDDISEKDDETVAVVSQVLFENDANFEKEMENPNSVMMVEELKMGVPGTQLDMEESQGKELEQEDEISLNNPSKSEAMPVIDTTSNDVKDVDVDVQISDVLKPDANVSEEAKTEDFKPEKTDIKAEPISPEKPKYQELNPSQSNDDDHDALHLTIRDEEVDKFMMEGDDGENNKPSEEDETTESVKVEIKEERLSQGSNEGICTTSQEDKGGSHILLNHVSSSSKDVKSIDKTSEGRIRQKSKDEERNTLLVTGLSALTAATDLKSVFKKFGKIGGVKIMSNAKDPDGSRFALVAVPSTEDVVTCLAKLDGYELHGRIIHVEKAGDDMLTADWSRKEGNRDSSLNRKSNAGKKSEPDKKDVKVKQEGKQGSEKTVDKDKPSKRSQEKSTPKSSQEASKSVPSVAPSKPDSRRKSATSNGEKSSNKDTKAKDKQPSTRPAKPFMNRKTGFRPGVREKREFERKFRRGNFGRQQPGRVERNPRPDREPPRHQPDGREFSRHQFSHTARGRGRDVQRRFHGPSSGAGSHGRDNSPARSPYRRPSTEPRRAGGRQPELTFEDIYDIREREKRRELDRERREVERRRQEDEQKQILLDQEIRMLARQRERIEQEKLELKRQKERMIMVEREKQREERERLHREKEEIQRRLEEGRRASKRTHAEDAYEHFDRKKPILDERARHAISYIDTHNRPEKEKVRTEVYRRSDSTRYKPLDNLERRSLTPVRGAPMRNAPVRDSRAPNWENERGVREKTPDRLTYRDREPVKPSRTEDRRDERKAFPLASTAEVPRYSHETPANYTIPSAAWTSRHTEAKNETYVSSGMRDDRWTSRGVSTFTSDPHTSQLQTVSRDNSWQSGRETSWSSSDRYVSERTASRAAVTEMPERWGPGTGSSSALSSSNGRMPIPVAPPPPIFSSTAGAILLNPSAQQFSGTRYEYDYPKVQSLQRRQ